MGRRGVQSKDDALFNIWLDQRLRDAFEDISNEPAPSGLITLIEQHRRES